MVYKLLCKDGGITGYTTTKERAFHAGDTSFSHSLKTKLMLVAYIVYNLVSKRSLKREMAESW